MMRKGRDDRRSNCDGRSKRILIDGYEMGMEGYEMVFTVPGGL